MKIKCVVAASGGDGPDLVPYWVELSKAQYDDAQHYDACRDQANQDGYDIPMVVFDENDGPQWLFGHWSQEYWNEQVPVLRPDGGLLV